MLSLAEISCTAFGTRGSVLGGAALVWKNSFSFLPFSSLSSGYQLMSAGEPSKKSGMKTRYGCSLSLWARMSAPWMVCGKKPKMS